MKRLLCILSSMDAGGAESFLMKVYRCLDRNNYQMDFCINVNNKCFYEDEIYNLGGKIYRIPSKSENVREFRKQLTEIVKQGGYKYVLRITSNAMGFMDLKISKKAGAKICCARSSNSSDGGTIKSFFAHQIGRILYSHYVDVRIAPSDLAAKYTFGRYAYENKKVAILRNGLDLNTYSYSEIARKEIRNEFRISENAFVVGHVGRFDEQKNHKFLIDVFKEIKQQRENAFLLLVGAGPLMNNIQKEIENSSILDVIFTGIRHDVSKLLSAMDVFVFPSLYEGMPNTVIEAQATGLPCILSDTITREAAITDNVIYLSLYDKPVNWAEKAINCTSGNRKEARERLTKMHYNIESVVKDFASTIFIEGK